MIQDRNTVRTGLIGMAAGLALAALLLGAYQLGRSSSAEGFPLPETVVQAMASHGSKTMAIATGPIDEGEGLFVLDYLTGELQCFVCNPRGGGRFFAHFRANVVEALGVEQGKTPDYLLVLGAMEFTPRQPGVARPGHCVAYVCDANTGNIAAFGVPWNRNAASTGQPQRGALVLLDVAKARNLNVIE